MSHWLPFRNTVVSDSSRTPAAIVFHRDSQISKSELTGRVQQASSVGVPELPTGMMTTPYARLISEPNLLHWRIRDAARDRRAVYVLVFWAGAFTGAALERWIASWLTFGLGVGCKALAMGMVFMAKEEGSRRVGG